MTLLIHDHVEGGQVGLVEAHIAGQHVPARTYHHHGKCVEVEHEHAHVVEHDVAALQQRGYRLATAEEQELHAKSKKKATHIKEGK